MAIYGTTAGADTYHAARGNDAWALLSEPAKAAALQRGTDYVDGRCRWQLPSGRWESMFPGEKVGGRAQEREWPRIGAVDYAGNAIDSSEVPREVDHATYEAALREGAAPGSLSPDFVPSAQVTKEKVGPVEIGYASPQAGDNSTPNRPIVPLIDAILAPVTSRPYEFPAVFVV